MVQRIFFYIAPPFAVVFLLGLLWRRANATAAVATIISGFLFLVAAAEGIRFRSERVIVPPLWDAIAWLTPYKQAYQHSALLTWIFCMIVMIVTSLLTAPPPQGAGRADHLEPQLPLAAAGRARALQRLEGFSHLVAGVRRHRAGDLWVFPVVRFVAVRECKM